MNGDLRFDRNSIRKKLDENQAKFRLELFNRFFMSIGDLITPEFVKAAFQELNIHPEDIHDWRSIVEQIFIICSGIWPDTWQMSYDKNSKLSLDVHLKLVQLIISIHLLDDIVDNLVNHLEVREEVDKVLDKLLKYNSFEEIQPEELRDIYDEILRLLLGRPYIDDETGKVIILGFRDFKRIEQIFTLRGLSSQVFIYRVGLLRVVVSGFVNTLNAYFQLKKDFDPVQREAELMKIFRTLSIVNEEKLGIEGTLPDELVIKGSSGGTTPFAVFGWLKPGSEYSLRMLEIVQTFDNFRNILINLMNFEKEKARNQTKYFDGRTASPEDYEILIIVATKKLLEEYDLIETDLMALDNEEQDLAVIIKKGELNHIKQDFIAALHQILGSLELFTDDKPGRTSEHNARNFPPDLTFIIESIRLNFEAKMTSRGIVDPKLRNLYEDVFKA